MGDAEQLLKNAIRVEKTAQAKDKYLKVKASLEIMKHPEAMSGLNKTVYAEKLKELNRQVEDEKKALGDLLNAELDSSDEEEADPAVASPIASIKQAISDAEKALVHVESQMTSAAKCMKKSSSLLQLEEEFLFGKKKKGKKKWRKKKNCKKKKKKKKKK